MENKEQVDMVGSKRVTISELAEHLNQEYVVVSSLVKFLTTIGAAKVAGTRAMPVGTRGKPATEYFIPNNCELVFWEDNEKENENVLPAPPVEEKTS